MDVLNAYQVALQARAHSYSPYSKFKVGAALKIRGQGQAIGGCNIENASFGATVCAERSALHAAISQFGPVVPEFLVVVTGEAKATVPCALCLQSLAEFCDDAMPIYLGNERELLLERKFGDFLPYAFRTFAVPK